MENSVYLDHASTSPIHPEVLKAMIEVMGSESGNPSSVHFRGRQARKALDQARSLIAEQIQAHEKEIIFTSGGTESNNTAIIGAALANQNKGNHIITSAIEHPVVLEPCKYLESKGFKVTYLPVDENGIISLLDLEKALDEATILVSIMYGNNEIGSIQPIAEIGEYLKEHQALFHTDAVQAFGIAPLNVNQLSVDLMSTSSHKINGPGGVGFLYIRSGTPLVYPFHGGSQEYKRRPGTENLAGICGFAEAARITIADQQIKKAEYQNYKAHMQKKFTEANLHFTVHGTQQTTLAHILSIWFKGISTEQLLTNLDILKIAASSGSACTAGTVATSHVLAALYGEGHPATKETIRVSFGLGNTFNEIDQAANSIIQVIKRLEKRKGGKN